MKALLFYFFLIRYFLMVSLNIRTYAIIYITVREITCKKNYLKISKYQLDTIGPLGCFCSHLLWTSCPVKRLLS